MTNEIINQAEREREFWRTKADKLERENQRLREEVVRRGFYARHYRDICSNYPNQKETAP